MTMKITKATSFKIDWRKKALGAALAAGIAAGSGFCIWSSGVEDTDNAYTAGHVATLSPKVGGLITEVLVEENYKVKKDQVLVRIDSRDYQNALNSLKAESGSVEA